MADTVRDTDLRRSPLQHLARHLSEASSAENAVTLEEIRFPVAINLRGDGSDARFRAGVRNATGSEPPTVANTFTQNGANRCLWLGPDEWLVTNDTGERIEADLAAALAGQAACIVEVSAGYATLRLGGGRAREVLSTACPLDLHPRAFRVGQCAQSIFARTQVIVALEDERPLFRLLVRRSFAAYVAEWLLDAMRGSGAG